MPDPDKYIAAFDALVLSADILRAEAARSTEVPPPVQLIMQANVFVHAMNDSLVLPFRLETIATSDWTVALRQMELILQLAGRASDSILEDGKSTREAPVVVDRATGVSARAESKGKPRVFLGCSVEGLAVAKILQLQLRYSTDTIVWHQGVFGLSTGTLETLVAQAGAYDYAVLVLTPDDLLIKRDATANAARDNVLFELGLFIGALGRDHVYMVVEDGVELPTDLAGIKPARFVGGPVGQELQARLGPVATELEIAMAII